MRTGHEWPLLNSTSNLNVHVMKISLLRNLLLLDAAILFLLGAVFVLAPTQIEAAFRFKDLPPGVSYIIGLWGCMLGTMGAGYVVAAMNPIRHVIWIKVGIARGALELLLGFIYLARGVVTFPQAGFGIIVAGLMSLAYIVLYPRRPRVIARPTAPAQEAPGSSS